MAHWDHPDELIALKRYVQTIADKPRPFGEQETKREGPYLWCEDWEIIEVCKCLFHGELVYRGDPPPNRLKGNPLFNPEQIIAMAWNMKSHYKTAAAIIEEFDRRRNGNKRGS